MRSVWLWIAAASMTAGCSFSGPGGAGSGSDASADPDGPAADAAADAMVVLSPWGTPSRVTELELDELDGNYDDPSITDSGMLYYAARGGVSVDGDIYRAQRQVDGSFGPPELVAELSNTNPGQRETNLWVERDHSRIVFGLNGDLFESIRDPGTDEWAAPVPLDGVNDIASTEGLGQLTDGGLTLYFVSDRDNNPAVFDIFRATRPALDQPFDSIDKLPVSSPGVSQLSVKLSADGLTMYWSEKPAGAPGSAYEIVFSERADIDDEFTAGTPIAELMAVNAIDSDFTPSPDHRSAFFSSDRADLAEGERIFFVER